MSDNPSDVFALAADIQLIGTSIKRINFTNSIVNYGDGRNADHNIKLSSDIITVEETDNGLQAILQLNIILGIKETHENDNKELNTSLDFVIEGCFYTKELKQDEFINFVYVNGGSTLYAIARSQIMNLTSDAFAIGKVTLPMINMLKFLQQREMEQNKDKAKSNKQSADKGEK